MLLSVRCNDHVFVVVVVFVLYTMKLWCVAWFSFHVLNQLCIPGINPT